MPARHMMLVLALTLLSACSMQYAVRLRNLVGEPVTIEFYSPSGGLPGPRPKELRPGQSRVYLLGDLQAHQMVVRTPTCDFTYPRLVFTRAEIIEWPVRTDVAITKDGALYVWFKGSPVQPKGWPLRPERTSCR